MKKKEEYPNKITEKELRGFIPKSLCGEEYTYKHSEDCKMSGCPSHKARIKYHSTSDLIEIDLIGDGDSFYLDGTQANIIWDWFNRAKIT